MPSVLCSPTAIESSGSGVVRSGVEVLAGEVEEREAGAEAPVDPCRLEAGLELLALLRIG